MFNNMPLVKALNEYVLEDTVRFHMPGHKKGRGFPGIFRNNLAAMDVTEVPDLDVLGSASGCIGQAQELASSAFGADSSFFLVNGSSCGIQAMIMSALKPGDYLI